jgi:hypothetical protein
MASGPTLPPQAYTREILTSAFNWLQTQPDSVRKLATTPDALVGLFTRARRFGNSSLEADAPVSGQNFMSDLKNLAEGLKQFEDSKAAPLAQRPAISAVPGSAMSAQTVLNQTNQQVNQQVHQVNHISQVFTPSGSQTMGGQVTLNERSLVMIQEVKEQLNLSSDVEVLNMMIALAYKSLKHLLS